MVNIDGSRYRGYGWRWHEQSIDAGSKGERQDPEPCAGNGRATFDRRLDPSEQRGASCSTTSDGQGGIGGLQTKKAERVRGEGEKAEKHYGPLDKIRPMGGKSAGVSKVQKHLRKGFGGRL